MGRNRLWLLIAAWRGICAYARVCLRVCQSRGWGTKGSVQKLLILSSRKAMSLNQGHFRIVSPIRNSLSPTHTHTHIHTRTNTQTIPPSQRMIDGPSNSSACWREKWIPAFGWRHYSTVTVWRMLIMAYMTADSKAIQAGGFRWHKHTHRLCACWDKLH